MKLKTGSSGDDINYPLVKQDFAMTAALYRFRPQREDYSKRHD